jgi:hypothetical protein
MGRGDAMIGGANGDAPGPRRPSQGFHLAAGEAAVEFLGIGKDAFSDAKPGITDGAFKI